jgi:hypothetical protein
VNFFRRKETNVNTDAEIARLSSRIAEIDRRLATVDSELDGVNPRLGPGTYARQERQAERTDLLRLRREAQLALDALRTPPPPVDPQRQASVDAWVLEQEQNYDQAIERFESQGDHRQARLWRMERLKIRDEVERLVG